MMTSAVLWTSGPIFEEGFLPPVRLAKRQTNRLSPNSKLLGRKAASLQAWNALLIRSTNGLVRSPAPCSLNRLVARKRFLHLDET